MSEELCELKASNNVIYLQQTPNLIHKKQIFSPINILLYIVAPALFLHPVIFTFASFAVKQIFKNLYFSKSVLWRDTVGESLYSPVSSTAGSSMTTEMTLGWALTVPDVLWFFCLAVPSSVFHPSFHFEAIPRHFRFFLFVSKFK